MTAHDSRVCIRGSSAVGRRGAVLTSVPMKIVPDSASNEGVHQTEARRRAEIERVLAPAILDRDRWIEGLRFGTDVVLPEDVAGLRIERGDEAPAGTAQIAGDGGHELL